MDEVRDAFLDIHRIQLLIRQAQRGSVVASSSACLVSEKARLEARYHALVEALIHHYVHRRPPEALAALEDALATLRQETASFAAAVESASLEVRAQQINQARCGCRPESDAGDAGNAGDAGIAWAHACAEVIAQACLATIRRGPANGVVRFYPAMDGRWVAQRRVLIIPPQVQGKEGAISLPPVMLDERLPLVVFADLLVRPTTLSFPHGILAPFPGWEAAAQWRRSSGCSITANRTNTTNRADDDGAILPFTRLAEVSAITQHGASGQSGQAGGALAAIPAIPAMISAVTHQYLYPCQSEPLGLMWPAFACELSDPDGFVQSASGAPDTSGASHASDTPYASDLSA